jgi:hypothetical protein
MEVLLRERLPWHFMQVSGELHATDRFNPGEGTPEYPLYRNRLASELIWTPWRGERSLDPAGQTQPTELNTS